MVFSWFVSRLDQRLFALSSIYKSLFFAQRLAKIALRHVDMNYAS